MYHSELNSSSVSSESDYHHDDNFKPDSNASENENASNDSNASTIFDMPDFVIDVYLDAKNGGTAKDAGILVLSQKYGPSSPEENTNCNHNPHECLCTADHKDHNKEQKDCQHPQDQSCPESTLHKKIFDESTKCPCSESIYETGANAFVEFPKKQCCTDENPYEEGESPFEEKPKKHICPCHLMEDSMEPYELGAPPYKKNPPCDPPKPAPEKGPEQCNPNCPCNKINFTSPCSGKLYSEFESEAETGTLVVSNIEDASNNNRMQMKNMPIVQDVPQLGSMADEDEVVTTTAAEVVENCVCTVQEDQCFPEENRGDDVTSCTMC